MGTLFRKEFVVYGTWKQAFLLTEGDTIQRSINSEKEYLLMLSSPGEQTQYGMVHVKYPRVAPMKEEVEPELRILCAGYLRVEMEAFLREYDWLPLVQIWGKQLTCCAHSSRH